MFIEIPGSKTSPHIVFKDGVLLISGTSMDQETSSIFDPLLKTMNDYIMNPNKITRIETHLEYINSNSMRSLMNILIVVEKLHFEGNKVFMDWYYHDDKDIINDVGTIFQSILDFPIYLKKC